MQVANATFTRPSDTTAYASGDLVANSTTAGSVTALAFESTKRGSGSFGKMVRSRVAKSSTSTTNASFRLHLFTSPPSVTNGDNGAIIPNKAADYLGSVDVTVDRVTGDGAVGIGSLVAGSEINFSTAAGAIKIYGLLEARGAYTPTSAEVFTVQIEID